MNTEEYKKMFNKSILNDLQENGERAKEYLEKQKRDKWKNSNLDIKLKKRKLKTFWWSFGFAVIIFGFSVYNFINNLSPSESVIKQEERIEKMESELEKLQTSILNQKTKDSLSNSKVLKTTENTGKSKDK